MWFRIALRYPVALSRCVGGIWFLDSTNRICRTVATPAEPRVLTAILRAPCEPSVGPELAAKLRGHHDALTAMFAKHCLVEGRPRAALRLLAGARHGRNARLYLLTFLPGRVLPLLTALRHRLLGLS